MTLVFIGRFENNMDIILCVYLLHLLLEYAVDAMELLGYGLIQGLLIQSQRKCLLKPQRAVSSVFATLHIFKNINSSRFA